MHPGYDESHQHRFQPAGIIMLSNVHPITQQVFNRPALVKLCFCDLQVTEWVRDPVDPKPLPEAVPDLEVSR